LGSRMSGTVAGALLVSSIGIRRFSNADVERARLLHQYALHQCRPDAER
jgi:hypothetical protein